MIYLTIIIENLFSNVIQYVKSCPLRAFMEFMIILLIQYYVFIPLFLYIAGIQIDDAGQCILIAAGLSYFGLSHAALSFKSGDTSVTMPLMEMKVKDLLSMYFIHLAISIFGVLLPLMWLGSVAGMTLMVGGLFYVVYLIIFK